MNLIAAEVLKLRRRRGLMAWSVILTVGSVIVTQIVLIVLHAVNPAHHGPAGGRTNLEAYAFLLAQLGAVTAILIGSAAGTQDVSNGVFRDLVVTGRPRSTLFDVRIPGALIVFGSMLAVGGILAFAVVYLLAGTNATPSGSYVWHTIVYVVSYTGLNLILAIGIAAFTSSRVVVGVLIAWNSIVSHLLMSIHALGSARKLIDVAAAEHFSPAINGGDKVAMSGTTAVLVLIGWAAAASLAGRWWTGRRDA
jgi:hypothetical protein